MADKNEMVPQNAPGKYYVDSNCVFCGTCMELAPEHFASYLDEYAYVKRQPENQSEENACQEAMESCPTEAIGNNGE